jgi:hypothetical protein
MVLFTAIPYLPVFPSPSPHSSSSSLFVLQHIHASSALLSTISAYTEASTEQSTDIWT